MIKNKDFNILLIGRILANLGDSIYAIATTLLVYNLTQSVFYSGFALFLTSSMGVFQILLSPLLDRINLKKSLIFLQLSQGILLFILTVLLYTENISVSIILIIMPIVTLLNQIIYPGQISILPKILKPEEMIKANSLFAMAYQGSDTIFNALTGVIITIIGITSTYLISSSTFFINAILFTFLSSAISNLNISNKKQTKYNLSTSIKLYFREFKEGMAIWKNKLLLPILVGVILINVSATSIQANLPGFATSDIHYSLLAAASGIGVLIGSFIISKIKIENLSINKVYISSIFIMGIFWISAFLVNPATIYSQVATTILFVFGWIPVGIINVLSQTVIQISVPKERLGMAMGSMIGVSTILAPIGALLGGFLGELIGSSTTMIISSCLVLVVGVFWISQRSIRSLSSINSMKEKLKGAELC